MCFKVLKSARDLTDTSPNRIIPKNAQIEIAHMQASKGWSIRRVALMAVNMRRVIGGLSGLHRDPCKFSIPQSDQFMRVRFSADSGGDHPCAKCQARIAERYFLTTVTDTGSNGTDMEVNDLDIGSAIDGSDTAQRENECKTLNRAGSRFDSGMENMSQNK